MHRWDRCGINVMKDNDILQAVAENDASLRAFVASSIRNSSAADDVVQDIWKAAITQIKRYDSARSFRTWLFGIAKMQVLKWRQSMARNIEFLLPEVIELAATTAEEAEEIDDRLAMMKPCFAKLSRYDRQILDLKYYQEMKSADIAKKLGKNVASVEMATTRARRHLKVLMEEMQAEVKAKAKASGKSQTSYDR